MELERTCWRGLAVGHPRDWELSLASGADEPGRCSFSDRYQERLRVEWHVLQRVPDLDGMLHKYRHRMEKKDSDVVVHEMPHAPEPWVGVTRRTPEGWITNAGRLFRQRRWLVEVTFLWSGGPDAGTEAAVLESIDTESEDVPARRWHALGLRVAAPRGYDLATASTQVGRVRWEFLPPRGERDGAITVERLAMPDMWLKRPLRDWLAGELPPHARTVRQDAVACAPHGAEQIISTSRITPLLSLLGIRRLRVDRAWRCPIEDRIYHMSYAVRSRGELIELPDGLEVQCCGGRGGRQE